MASERASGRIKDANQKRVLDTASRRRRARKALEALEQDNFHDDPHADLVMSKKVPKFNETLEQRGSRKKKARSAEYFKQRYRKSFAQMIEEDKMYHPDPPHYAAAEAPPSKLPERRFCAVCGFPSNYTCIPCGARYCCIRCLEFTRPCVKPWTLNSNIDMKPIISSKQLKKTLAAKAKKVNKVRNVLALPHRSSFWPALDERQDTNLLALIERLLLPAKLPKTAIRRLQPQVIVSAAERTEIPKAKCATPTDSCKKLRSSLLLGINAVSRSLEKHETSAVLLAGDINPPIIGRHIVDMCCSQQVPVVVMPSLRRAMQKSLGFACIALGLKRVEMQDSHFLSLQERVTELSSLFPTNEAIQLQKSDDEEPDVVSDDTAKVCDQEDPVSSVDFYKYRTSRKERVFVPCELPTSSSASKPDIFLAKNTETKEGEFGDDFISFDLNVKPEFKTVVCKSNSTTNRGTESKKRKMSHYQPLVVKCIQSNPNKKKKVKKTVG